MKKIVLLSVLLILFQSFILAQGSGKNGKLIYTFGYNEVPARSNLPLIGFVNMAHGDQKSLHVGFINTNTGNLTGAQIGFINAVKKLEGFQVGFINASQSLKGFQVGFINGVERIQGAQIGFVNVTRILTGFELGFINKVETVTHGVPVGFLSFVRHVGLRAALRYRF